MLAGLYLSAAGVMTNSYRQDVISNNIANAQTTGFKKDLAMFRQRPVASEEMPGKHSWSDPLLDKIGGGIYAEPTRMDMTQGGLEPTGNNLDAAIYGSGFFTVQDGDQTRLTRDGSFEMDSTGQLVTADGAKLPVLDVKGQPIKLNAALGDKTLIARDGTISQDNAVVAQLRVVDVPDSNKLQNIGGTLLAYPDASQFTTAKGEVRGGFIESANVDPAVELTDLMETQRNLEANANMIHYQDQTLDKLVNNVGRIS